MSKSTSGKQSSGAMPAAAIDSPDEQPQLAVIAGGKAKTPRAKLEHVGPERFAALRDELGFSNKDVAAAISRTLSRVSELTHSDGGSINVWNTYEAALRAYTPPVVPEAETE